MTKLAKYGKKISKLDNIIKDVRGTLVAANARYAVMPRVGGGPVIAAEVDALGLRIQGLNEELEQALADRKEILVSIVKEDLMQTEVFIEEFIKLEKQKSDAPNQQVLRQLDDMIDEKRKEASKLTIKAITMLEPAVNTDQEIQELIKAVQPLYKLYCHAKLIMAADEAAIYLDHLKLKLSNLNQGEISLILGSYSGKLQALVEKHSLQNDEYRKVRDAWREVISYMLNFQINEKDFTPYQQAILVANKILNQSQKDKIIYSSICIDYSEAHYERSGDTACAILNYIEIIAPLAQLKFKKEENIEFLSHLYNRLAELYKKQNDIAAANRNYVLYAQKKLTMQSLSPYERRFLNAMITDYATTSSQAGQNATFFQPVSAAEVVPATNPIPATVVRRR